MSAAPQMEFTAFGFVSYKRETRTELKERAKELFHLWSLLRDNPLAIEQRRGMMADVQYFIDLAKAHKMCPNAHDGLNRLTGCLEELLTLKDRRQMTRNRKLWRKTPAAMTWWVGGYYCVTLHPKEIAYLQKQIEELQREVSALEADVPEIEKRIAELRAFGPFPLDVAERYRINTDGTARDPAANRARAKAKACHDGAKNGVF